ncbi:hypothetical protein PGTUg99_008298 [Puccinia graminis f. sp. tritici]|uniref:Uncharacterized protein n=1 Tax=Puccinia graminis f. sp. tritici TaxID=56615 RepID=A0A5B0S4Q0_PUCGR|nr:hypothetical protein PGTUg99_008298 [Puccinia graminis f. sp. tritici]
MSLTLIPGEVVRWTVTSTNGMGHRPIIITSKAILIHTPWTIRLSVSSRVTITHPGRLPESAMRTGTRRVRIWQISA